MNEKKGKWTYSEISFVSGRIFIHWNDVNPCIPIHISTNARIEERKYILVKESWSGSLYEHESSISFGLMAGIVPF